MNIRFLLLSLFLGLTMLPLLAQDNRQNEAKYRRDFACPETLPAACDAPKDSHTGNEFFLPDPVFFRLDKYVIDNSEWSKIEKLVNYMKEHPTAKVVVTGYADKNTGNPKYNLKLSERRSNVVADAIQKKYKIDKSRISTSWKGDMVQPFDLDQFQKNRLVLFLICPDEDVN